MRRLGFSTRESESHYLAAITMNHMGVCLCARRATTVKRIRPDRYGTMDAERTKSATEPREGRLQLWQVRGRII